MKKALTVFLSLIGAMTLVLVGVVLYLPVSIKAIRLNQKLMGVIVGVKLISQLSKIVNHLMWFMVEGCGLQYLRVA